MYRLITLLLAPMLLTPGFVYADHADDPAEPLKRLKNRLYTATSRIMSRKLIITIMTMIMMIVNQSTRKIRKKDYLRESL